MLFYNMQVLKFNITYNNNRNKPRIQGAKQPSRIKLRVRNLESRPKLKILWTDHKSDYNILF